MKCSDFKELLSAYANDELSRAQREFVEEHLAGCADCQATVEEYRETRRHLMSLRTTPFISDIKGVTMSKIKGQNNGRTVLNRMRPVLIAVPLAVVLIALAVMQPWSPGNGPESIIAKAYAATESVQSYRFDVAQVSTSGQEARLGAEYSSPDRYYVRMSETGKDGAEELIVIGDKQYVKNIEISRNMVTSTVTGLSSLLKKETTLGMMELLTDLQDLPVERIDGTECLHYKGRVDFEKQIAETRRSMQELRERAGSDRPTDEEIEENLEQMRSINIEVELWIGKGDNLLRQMKQVRQVPDSEGVFQTSSTTYRYYDFNQPVTIEPPLDAEGNLLDGWQIAGSITPDSKQPVFTYGITSSIGAQPGYNDAAHQRARYEITITNQSSETVRNVRVLLSTEVTDEEQKPAVMEGEPENPGRQEFPPDESETYYISWNFNGSHLSKLEILELMDKNTITVQFTTQDGRELTQLIYPHTRHPTQTPPTEAERGGASPPTNVQVS